MERHQPNVPEADPNPSTPPTPDQARPTSSPILSKVLSGSFWLALKTPIAAVCAFWTIPLLIRTYGDAQFGAYGFAWGFGFFQMLLEFGMSSALQRQVVTAWARGDRQAVERSLASGMVFYGIVTLIQSVLLIVVAHWAVPLTEYAAADKKLIIQLLWLQALTAPCWGLSTVISSILQAAHRYDVIPRFEVLAVIGRFLALVLGIWLGWPLLAVVIAQTFVQIVLILGPAIWIAVREFGMFPGFRGASWSEFMGMIPLSLWVFMIQLSVVLADKLDTTVLGFALSDPGPATSIYQVVSKPFMQLRQTGWTLAYFVMPAAASLAAARDKGGLDRVKYDGVRLHFGLLLPVGLLAAIYARPFLELWVGPSKAQYAPMMRLFLVACLPLILSVPVQVSTGLGHVRVVALAALGGSIINLPLSYYLTIKLGVVGVIWGTVLTTLFSNLLIPGIYTYRTLSIDPREFLRRSLAPALAGSILLAIACLGLGSFLDASAPGQASWMKLLILIGHLMVAMVAYGVGYLLVPSGREDGTWLKSKFGRLRG
ncbi:MAG: polysaccharide biosynthesis protein [Planctomycetota bacterium]|nr:MAG: polysaccharide biosynthesis protein [Planctomycetota bacterium]